MRVPDQDVFQNTERSMVQPFDGVLIPCWAPTLKKVTKGILIGDAVQPDYCATGHFRLSVFR
jgi:hypothetical protein